MTNPAHNRYPEIAGTGHSLARMPGHHHFDERPSVQPYLSTSGARSVASTRSLVPSDGGSPADRSSPCFNPIPSTPSCFFVHQAEKDEDARSHHSGQEHMEVGNRCRLHLRSGQSPVDATLTA